MTGDIFYVGIGDEKRPYQKGKGRRSNWWNNIVNKYGVPITTIIHENLSWVEASSLEIFYIAKIGRADLGLGPLINLTNGGDGVKGRVCREETKQKIRETKLGDKNPMFGKTFSAEHRKKLGDSKSGEKHWRFGNGPMIISTRTKIANARTGTKLSDETCKKLSNSSELSWKTRKSCSQSVLIFGKEYKSLRTASKEIGITRFDIRNKCLDKNNIDFKFT